jgi:hypothetical protein
MPLGMDVHTIVVEAPNEEATHTVRRGAHGLIAEKIYEVQEGT